MNFKKSLLLLVLAVVPVIGYTVNAQDNTVYDPTPLSTVYPIQDNSARALIALAAMYAPMENEAAWAQMVLSLIHI